MQSANGPAHSVMGLLKVLHRRICSVKCCECGPGLTKVPLECVVPADFPLSVSDAEDGIMHVNGVALEVRNVVLCLRRLPMGDPVKKKPTEEMG